MNNIIRSAPPFISSLSFVSSSYPDSNMQENRGYSDKYANIQSSDLLIDKKRNSNHSSIMSKGTGNKLGQSR